MTAVRSGLLDLSFCILSKSSSWTSSKKNPRRSIMEVANRRAGTRDLPLWDMVHVVLWYVMDHVPTGTLSKLGYFTPSPSRTVLDPLLAPIPTGPSSGTRRSGERKNSTHWRLGSQGDAVPKFTIELNQGRRRNLKLKYSILVKYVSDSRISFIFWDICLEELRRRTF